MHTICRLLITTLLVALSIGLSAAQPDIQYWSDVAWSPDGAFVIGVQNEIVTYVYADGQLQRRDRLDPYHMLIDRVSWSPDSRRFVFSADDSLPGSEGDAALAVWAMPEFTRQRDWLSDKFETDTPDHLSQIEHATWHPDGQRIISLVTQGEALLLAHWDAVTLTPTLLPFQSAPTYVRTIALSPQGDWLAVAGVFAANTQTSPELQVIDVQTGALLWQQTSEDAIADLDWLDATRFAILRSNRVEIWSVSSDGSASQQTTLNQVPREAIRRIRSSPDGTRLAVLTSDGALEVWSVQTGAAETLVPREEAPGVLAFDWHPDGTHIAYAVNFEWDLALVEVPASETP